MSSLERLNTFWTESMADCSIQPHNLKHQFKDRWVRFHSLPESKRYAESEDEYTIIFSRHHSILGALTTMPGQLYLTVPEYSESASPTCPEIMLINLYQGFIPWKSESFAEEEGEEDNPYHLHLHLVEIEYPDKNLDTLFKLVADDKLRHVMITCPESSWIFHPYDGGADVILKDSTTRDQLKNKYRDWLSTYPGGF